MSSSEQRWPANAAFMLTLELMGLITDCTDRLEIAGSLRRDRQEVGDVELVMTPIFEAEQNLFGATGKKVNLLDQRCDELLKLGIVEKRLNKNNFAIAWAERYKALVYKGLPVDLFIVLPDRQWGPTMLIRTGPGGANQVLVTTDGVKNAEGNLGILPKGMTWQDGALWSSNARMVSTPEEIDVFKAIGLPYIPPYARTVDEYRLWAGRRGWHREFDHRPASGKAGRVPGYGYAELKWEVQPTFGREPLALEPEQSIAPENQIHIADGLILEPKDFVGQHVAVLGMTGMGKSNLVAVLCEELSRHIQMTIIDLEGEYHSLREAHPFLVVGRGDHVNRVVELGDAKRLVGEIMESGQSVILDMYDFNADERDEFLRLYLDQLFEVEGTKRKPHIVVMEEAAEFLGQRKKSAVSEVAIKVARRGRKRGIGLVMVSQRFANLDKDALNMSRILFLLGVQFPQDIAVYRGVLPKSFPVEDALNQMRVGQAIVRRFGQGGKQQADVFTVRRRKTKDLGATPMLEQLSQAAPIPA